MRALAIIPVLFVTLVWSGVTLTSIVEYLNRPNWGIVGVLSLLASAAVIIFGWGVISVALDEVLTKDSEAS